MGIKRKFTELRAWAADNPACIKAAGCGSGRRSFSRRALYQWGTTDARWRRTGPGVRSWSAGKRAKIRRWSCGCRPAAWKKRSKSPCPGREYTEEELDAAFEDAQAGLQELILGENPGPDEVRTDLELITEVPGTDIGVSWEMDRYDVIDPQGNIIGEDLPEEGDSRKPDRGAHIRGQEAVLRIRRLRLSAGNIRRKKNSWSATSAKRRNGADGDTRSEAYMVLPDKAGGEALRWMPGEEKRALGIAVLGLGRILHNLRVGPAEEEREREK